jgi:hypothetical protein
VVPKKWTLRRDGDLSAVPNRKMLIDFATAINRERHKPRLVKLGIANQQRVLMRIIVAQRKPDQFSESQARGVEEHYRQTQVFPTEW